MLAALVNSNLSNSKILWGLASVITSMSSRFVISDITPAQHGILAHAVFKRIAVFCMVFLPTRDFFVSVCITSVFFVLVDGLLNEHSRYCILPECIIHSSSIPPQPKPWLPVAHNAFNMSHGIRPHPGPKEDRYIEEDEYLQDLLMTIYS